MIRQTSLMTICFLVILGAPFVSSQTINLNTWDVLNSPDWSFGSDFGYAPSIDLSTDSPNPLGALRFEFPAGFQDGYYPAKAGYRFSQQDEIWYGFWFKFSKNWQWHPIVNKLSYVKNSDGNYFVSVDGDTKQFSMTNQITWGPGTQRWYPNTNSKTVVETGKWYWLEAHAKMNTPGLGDGLFELWLNNLLIIKIATVPYRQNNVGFDYYSLEPIWGGLCSPRCYKSVEDYIWYDYAVVSTAPIGAPGSSPQDVIPPASPQGLKVQ